MSASRSQPSTSQFIGHHYCTQPMSGMPKPTPFILTRAEVTHLLRLLARNEDDGIYSGPRAQYWLRSQRILDKLTQLVGGYCE